MDPISLAIVSALAKLSEEIVKDSYEALKSLIARKFGAESDLSRAVDNLEKKPDSAGRRGTLEEEVASSRADQDPELLKVAETLSAQVKELSGGQTVITQTIIGDRNIFSGAGDVNVTNKQ
jgi:hypothetical protein